MGSDKAMMIMLLYIIIVIMAFVFGITTSNTIAKKKLVSSERFGHPAIQKMS